MTKSRFTHQEIALLCLQEGGWLLGSLLLREDTPYGYLGKNGDRRARELEVWGQIERRLNDKNQVEYRITEAGLRRIRESRLPSALPKPRTVFSPAKVWVLAHPATGVLVPRYGIGDTAQAAWLSAYRFHKKDGQVFEDFKKAVEKKGWCVVKRTVM